MSQKQLRIEVALLRKEVTRMARILGQTHHEKYERQMWNWYRSIYPKLPFEQKKLLHEFWYRRYPGQIGYAGDMRFFLKSIRRVMNKRKTKRIKVVEYGGRAGELANQLFKKHPRMKWLNIEIISHKPLRGLKKRNYREHKLSKELWLEKLNLKQYDAFLSCNTLEHINGNQIYALFNYIRKNKIRFLILRVSTSPKGENWRNYLGTHVLKMGTNTMKNVLRARGYQLIEEENYERNLAYLKGWCSFWELKK